MNITDDDGGFYAPETPASVVDVSPLLSGSFDVDNFSLGNPWDPPTTINGSDTSNILADVQLPEIYSVAFNMTQPVVGKIPVTALNKILGVSGQPNAMIEKILNLAVPTSSTRVNRGEFNTALALIALAQKNMDVSIDNLILRKDDLPEPILPNLENISFNNRTLSFGNMPAPITRSATIEADPWATPGSSTNGFPTFQTSPSNSTVAPTPPIIATLVREEFQWFMDRDLITVTFVPEREGFLFKHVNYVVESRRRESRVIRRYSDFWWLMECLVKKYPFRILPALPPKKIGVNGFYFTVDESFLEKRRKGLLRFLIFIMRHPVLKDDNLVEMFMTEQQEIAAWRKTNVPDLEEEYLKKQAPPELEALIPADLDEKLNKVRKDLDGTIDHYRNMCNLMERIARRREGLATDFMRYSLALNSLIETNKGCYDEGCTDCTKVNAGLGFVSSHIQSASAIIEEEAGSTLETTLENLKQHRDLLVSFRELFERKDRLITDTTETLNTRIAANRAKLEPLSGKEDPESDRLSLAIEKDQEDLKLQQRRKVFIRHCLNAELSLFHKSSAFVSSLYQSFTEEEVKYSQKLRKNWESLNPKVGEMPNGFG